MPLDIQFDQIELDKNTQQILQAATSEQATTLIDSFEIIYSEKISLNLEFNNF